MNNINLLYIHNRSLDSSEANLIQVIQMCSAFTNNNCKVELLLPKHSSRIFDLISFINLRFGIVLNFKITFFEKTFNNDKIEKYFGTKKVYDLINNSNAEYVFLRDPRFISYVLSCNKKLIFEAHHKLFHNKYFLIDYYWKRKLINYQKNNNFKLFISISDNLKSYWISKGIFRKKIISIHDGFNDKAYNKMLDKEICRMDLNIPKEKLIVLYAGSLYPDREIENILFLAKKFNNVLFYVIGGPEKYSNFYIKLSKKENINNIYFLGRIAHKLIPKYLFASDILLAIWSNKVTTIKYCSPLKLFEYMASGKKIVTQNFTTILEVLDEKLAFIADNKSFNDLSKKLEDAISNKESSHGNLAREKAFKNYTWNIRVKKIINKLK